MSEDTKIIRGEILAWVLWGLVSPFLLFAFLTSEAGFKLIFSAALSGTGFLMIGGLAVLGGIVGIGTCRKQNGFIKGAVFFVLPLFELFLFLNIQKAYFSDESATKSAESKATTLLVNQNLIPINGLYTESISLRYGLYGMLVESRFPFVEIDSGSAQWLFALAEDQQSLTEKATQNPYVRLSLGPDDNQDCFKWKSESEDWLRAIPVRPKTCLKVVFDNRLVSDTRLHVNLDGLEKREMRWEITRINEDKPLATIPFWVQQFKDTPLNFDIRYRSGEDSSAFSNLMKKLAPSRPNLGVDGKPYVLSWVHATNKQILPLSEIRKASAMVRRLSESWDNKQAANETWEQGYQRAQQLQQPVVINNRIVVLPSSDEIFVNHNDFTLVVAKDCCVFVLMHRTSGSHGFRITGERFTGKQFWDIRVKPDSQLSDVSFCGADSNCNFYADRFTITDSDLIIVGRYNSGRSYSESYEWVVPLNQLPSWEQ